MEMGGNGAVKVTRLAVAWTVAVRSMWAEKPLASKVKLPASHLKKSSSSLLSELVAFPEMEACMMSMLPVTVQFLHDMVTPWGLWKE